MNLILRWQHYMRYTTDNFIYESSRVIYAIMFTNCDISVFWSEVEVGDYFGVWNIQHTRHCQNHHHLRWRQLAVANSGRSREKRMVQYPPASWTWGWFDMIIKFEAYILHYTKNPEITVLQWLNFDIITRKYNIHDYIIHVTCCTLYVFICMHCWSLCFLNHDSNSNAVIFLSCYVTPGRDICDEQEQGQQLHRWTVGALCWLVPQRQ